MAYMDRINRCNKWDHSRFVPFRINHKPVGWVTWGFRDTLRRFDTVFNVSEVAVDLSETLTTPDERTAAVERVARTLHQEGIIPTWRDEPYKVAGNFGEDALMRLERSAVSHFGTIGWGVHLNGYVRDGNRMLMWVGKRAADRALEPGKLDQLVAGGQPDNISLFDNLLKECAEEADMAPSLAGRAKPVGAISYSMDWKNGMRRDVLFCYDLELPLDWSPRNTDGEIESFTLMPIEQVAEIVQETDDFKFNCSLVVIDFLIRHGIVNPNRSDYLDLVKGLRQ